MASSIHEEQPPRKKQKLGSVNNKDSLKVPPEIDIISTYLHFRWSEHEFVEMESRIILLESRRLLKGENGRRPSDEAEIIAREQDQEKFRKRMMNELADTLEFSRGRIDPRLVFESPRKRSSNEGADEDGEQQSLEYIPLEEQVGRRAWAIENDEVLFWEYLRLLNLRFRQ